MSTVSTFGAFTTARLGIYSSSKWLDVIGNNISNINTEGYTRQSVDQISLYMGGADKYHTAFDMRVGNGGLVKRVTQLRDPYMDIRYRTEISSVGAMDAKLSGLKQIANILDEVAYGEDADGNLGVMELQFNDLISQMEQLVDIGAGEDEFDTNVRTSASALTRLFNSYASRLEELRVNMEDGLSADIEKINKILVNIRDLSDSIRKSNIYGGDALEQRDQRNLLIDQLAEYMRIDVKYEIEDLGGGLEVEKLVIALNGDDSDNTLTNKMVLVDGLYCTQLSIDHPVENKTGVDEATKPYLDKNGVPTDSIGKADREYNDHYAVVLSTLRDRWNRTEEVPYEQKGKSMGTYASEGAAENAAAGLPTSGIIDGKAYNFEYLPVQVKDDKGVPTGEYELIRKGSFTTQELTDNTLYGSIQAKRELLTEQGEYATKEQLGLDPDGDPLMMDRNAGSKRGIVYYQKALDTLANKFAAVMNSANQYTPNEWDNAELKALIDKSGVSGVNVSVNDSFDGKKLDTIEVGGESYFVAEAGCDLYLPGTTMPPIPDPNADDYHDQLTEFRKKMEKLKVPANGLLTEEQKEHLLPTEAGGAGHGTPVDAADARTVETNILFSNHGSGNDPTKITAANISISQSWADGSARIIQSTDPNHPSTDNTNLYHMLYLLTGTDQSFNQLGSDLEDTDAYADIKDRPAHETVMFKGTFQEMFTDNICGNLAADSESTSTMLNNYTTAADELYVDRDAISGVDLNDETMNLMQVQKSLTAAYRLMTVIDEMLERLISGTGVTR